MTLGPPVHHHNQVSPLDLGSCSARPMLGRIPCFLYYDQTTNNCDSNRRLTTHVCQKLQGLPIDVGKPSSLIQAVKACPLRPRWSIGEVGNFGPQSGVTAMDTGIRWAWMSLHRQPGRREMLVLDKYESGTGEGKECFVLSSACWVRRNVAE